MHVFDCRTSEAPRSHAALVPLAITLVAQQGKREPIEIYLLEAFALSFTYSGFFFLLLLLYPFSITNTCPQSCLCANHLNLSTNRFPSIPRPRPLWAARSSSPILKFPCNAREVGGRKTSLSQTNQLWTRQHPGYPKDIISNLPSPIFQFPSS